MAQTIRADRGKISSSVTMQLQDSGSMPGKENQMKEETGPESGPPGMDKENGADAHNAAKNQPGGNPHCGWFQSVTANH